MRAVSGLALLAMLVQIAVQAWHVPPVSGTTIKLDGDVPLIAICAGGVMKWIPVTELFGDAADDLGSKTDTSGSTDQEETPPKSAPFFCKICVGLSFAIVLAAIIGLAWLAPARRVDADRNGLPLLSPLSIHATAPRGPPIGA